MSGQAPVYNMAGLQRQVAHLLQGCLPPAATAGDLKTEESWWETAMQQAVWAATKSAYQ